MAELRLINADDLTKPQRKALKKFEKEQAKADKVQEKIHITIKFKNLIQSKIIISIFKFFF